MLPPVQAGFVLERASRRLLLGIFLAVAASFLFSACAGGPDLDRLAADNSLTTGAIAGSDKPASPDELDSDQAAMRNSASVADLSRMESTGIAWANPATGSRGTITGITEFKRQGMLCRAFSSTRESFDGVSLYRGQICLGPAGQWAMLDFNAA